MKEVWKDIDGYEGFYQISNMGRVRRLTILKTSHKYDRYMKVSLCKESVAKTFRIHRLVANAFLKNNDSNLVVNHKDGNRRNNTVANLEFITQKENIEHSIKLGLTKEFGETHSRAKLNNDLVLEMRKLHRDGLSISEIAEKYFLNYNTTRDAIKRCTWKHI